MPGAIAATVRNLRDIAPTIYFNVPKGFEMLVPYLRSRPRRCGKSSSAVSRSCSTPAPACRSTCGTHCRTWRSRPPANASFFSPASARPKPRRPRSPAPGIASAPAISACRRRASSSSSCRATASSRRALQGRQHHAGLLARARAHRRRLRRRGLLPDRRRAEVRRSGRSGEGTAVRRPPGRGFQALDRHLGQRRAAARSLHRPFCAAGARRGDGGRGSRRSRGFGLSRSRCLPQARARAGRGYAGSAVLAEPRVLARLRPASQFASPPRAAARRAASAAPFCSPTRRRSISAK